MPRTLKPEDRISHYRIVGPLGAGGMGEVYRARDQTLERDVALKILPPELVQSEERVRRFVLEAKSASSLNHPHIVTIYEIGQDRVRSADGAPEPDSSPLHFISMELVSGKTLAIKIHQEKTDLKTLLGWLAQAAEGLSKAHAAGIVHRDLKPGNIMITQDGYAKVLDFGLAKLTEREATGPDLSSAPTITDERTSEGAVLGTVGYMSPEQVQGKPVDQRSDIFSFGCMLYEAATRRRPFAAESNVETMHQILHQVPAPIEELNPEAPAELRRLIRRCLAKDPNRRLDSMRTLALELREIVEEYDALSASASSGSGPSGAVRTRLGGHGRQWASLTVAAVVVVAAIIVLLPKSPHLGSQMTFRTLPTPTPTISYPGLSPDGKWLVFGAADERNRWDLYLINVNGTEVRRITSDSSEFIEVVDISPDGSRLVYSVETRGENRLRLVSSLGGASSTLRQGGKVPRWSPDGARIGFISIHWVSGSQAIEFRTIRPDGNEERREFADSLPTIRGGSRISFAWSPDGRKVAWIRNFAGGYQELVARDLGTGHERQLTRDRKNIDDVCWTRQDDIVFSSSRGGNINLWVVRATGGPPVQLTRGSGPDLGIRVSADGRRLVYLEQQQTGRLWISPTDAANPVPVTRDELRLGAPAISPDGRQIAVPVFSNSLRGTAQLYLMNRDGNQRRPLTTEGWIVGVPRWSPDGRLAFMGRAPSDPVDSDFVYVLDPESSVKPQRIASASQAVWLDSTNLAVYHGSQTWRVSADGARWWPLGPESTFVWPATHRRYAVVHDQRAGREGMWLRVPGEGPDSFATYRRILSSDSAGGTRSSGADFLLLFKDGGRAERIALPSLARRPIPGVFAGIERRSGVGQLRWDGKELVYIEPQYTSRVVLIENLR